MISSAPLLYRRRSETHERRQPVHYLQQLYLTCYPRSHAHTSRHRDLRDLLNVETHLVLRVQKHGAEEQRCVDRLLHAVRHGGVQTAELIDHRGEKGGDFYQEAVDALRLADGERVPLVENHVLREIATIHALR